MTWALAIANLLSLWVEKSHLYYYSIKIRGQVKIFAGLAPA
jgi:hypothetical protein